MFPPPPLLTKKGKECQGRKKRKANRQNKAYLWRNHGTNPFSLSDWVIFIFIFELCEFCTYSRHKPQIIYIRYITCQYALLSHGLSFHFTDPII